MRDLKSLVNDYKPITESKEQIVIDEFAKSIIDRVFNNLAIIFPAWKHNWKSDDASDPDKTLRGAKREWTKAFVENDISTLEQISAGFAKARKANTDFLPSCGKFIAWCKPSPEDMGWPSVENALKACIKHRNHEKLFFKPQEKARALIVDLCNKVDWFLMSQSNKIEQVKKADKHFESVYMDMLNSGYVEPVAIIDRALPTERTVNEGKSPKQKEDQRLRGLDKIRAIKKGLKRK